VSITLESVAKKRIRLEITDNGIGLPVGWEKVQRSSLGLKLMKGLTDDIRGKFSIDSSNGTLVSIEFQEELFSHEPGRKNNKTMELQA
jgi:two-component sensor histidine kinase